MLSSLEEKLKVMFLSIIEASGLELIELSTSKLGSKIILRIFVDRQGGVTLDECTKLSSKISDFLDTEDPIPSSYILEVSSPGLDRPLTTLRDFQRKIGEKIIIFLKNAQDRRNYTEGILKQIENNQLVIQKNEEIIRFDLDEVAKAKLVLRP